MLSQIQILFPLFWVAELRLLQRFTFTTALPPLGVPHLFPILGETYLLRPQTLPVNTSFCHFLAMALSLWLVSSGHVLRNRGSEWEAPWAVRAGDSGVFLRQCKTGQQWERCEEGRRGEGAPTRALQVQLRHGEDRSGTGPKVGGLSWAAGPGGQWRAIEDT